MVFHGACCRLVFQNEACLRLHGQSMVGARFIGKVFEIGSGERVPMRVIRDKVFADQTFALNQAKTREHLVDYSLTVSFSPLRDRRRQIIGMRADGVASEAQQLRGPILADWLESLPLDHGQSAGLFPRGTAPETLADWRRRLALSLRQTEPLVLA